MTGSDSVRGRPQRLGLLLRFGFIGLAVYFLVWPIALAYVLRRDGMLGGMQIREFAMEYWASLPFMWTPGRELATTTQYLSVISTIVITLLVVVGTLLRVRMGQKRNSR